MRVREIWIEEVIRDWIISKKWKILVNESVLFALDVSSDIWKILESPTAKL